MVLRNTSAYPTDEVRELIEFATRDVDMTRVCINVKNMGRGSGWGGCAYDRVPEISNAPASAAYLITMRIAPPRRLELPRGPLNYNHRGPHEVGPRNRFPFFTIRTWQEVVVRLAAHESRHIHQYRHQRPRSEIECERFAERALELYRERLEREAG